ncbi:MAG: hypothetical protein Q4D51_04165 [Eubacteriales bacterium]|nr:hypothetical protein [Eubacteriales bacterium]
MEHTVKKSKANRVAMRVTALVFLLVGAGSFYAFTAKERGLGRFVLMILCAGCIAYGLYLMVQTLKAQAYDITYVFGDKQMTLKLHHKEKVYSYAEMTKLSYVVPNENMDYGVIQMYFDKEQYVIPFMGNRNVGEALYGMLEMKREEFSSKDQ